MLVILIPIIVFGVTSYFYRAPTIVSVPYTDGTFYYGPDLTQVKPADGETDLTISGYDVESVNGSDVLTDADTSVTFSKRVPTVTATKQMNVLYSVVVNKGRENETTKDDGQLVPARLMWMLDTSTIIRSDYEYRLELMTDEVVKPASHKAMVQFHNNQDRMVNTSTGVLNDSYGQLLNEASASGIRVDGEKGDRILISSESPNTMVSIVADASNPTDLTFSYIRFVPLRDVTTLE
jgi:hypothetical protein